MKKAGYGAVEKGLREYLSKKRTSFCMPGHKGKLNFDDLASFDVTEVCDTDDLNNPKKFIKDAMKDCAKIFGAQDTYFMQNGSTGAIHAAMAATIGYGDCVIIDRNCHKSVINAGILLGIDPVFIRPDKIVDFGISGGINPEALSCLIQSIKAEGKNPKAFILTSPSYYGVVSDVAKISEIVHQNDMILIVDEAHGAHFGFSQILPDSAVKNGADIVVQSVHKTLGAISSSALIHICSDAIDTDKVASAIEMFQTSSPSYAMLVQLERAILEARSFGAHYQKMAEAVDICRKKLNVTTKAFWIGEEYKGICSVFDIDKTRIVINFSRSSLFGYDVAKILREKYNIETEASDRENIVCIFTPYNEIKDIKKLTKAVLSIIKKADHKITEAQPCLEDAKIIRKMSPAKAYFGECDKVEIGLAVGKTACDIICKYPPGVPIVCPGEEILQEHIDEINELLEANQSVSGLTLDGLIRVAK